LFNVELYIKVPTVTHMALYRCVQLQPGASQKAVAPDTVKERQGASRKSHPRDLVRAAVERDWHDLHGAQVLTMSLLLWQLLKEHVLCASELRVEKERERGDQTMALRTTSPSWLCLHWPGVAGGTWVSHGPPY
jgi:hypothetical protein